LDPKTSEPFISVCDLIGQPCISTDFAVIGTANEQLYGMCEALWHPDLVCRVFFFVILVTNVYFFFIFVLFKEPADLFETISQALLNGFDRDAYSGWGAVVYIM
jgi:20S proteasome subunit beta 3